MIHKNSTFYIRILHNILQFNFYDRFHFDVNYISITFVYFLIRYILRSEITDMHNRNALLRCKFVSSI